ncbi:hypothetical protein Bbelb_437980 [Branchiostoma belcheri]|nr:hypothetical protein Bbelb_437980 [Branchiostoma belcheri]
MRTHLSEFRRRGESSPGKVTCILTCLHRNPHLSAQVSSPVYKGTLTCLHRYPHLSTQVSSPVYTGTLTCLHRYPHLSTQISSPVYTGILTCLQRYPHLSTQVPSPVYTGILICLCSLTSRDNKPCRFHDDRQKSCLQTVLPSAIN